MSDGMPDYEFHDNPAPPPSQAAFFDVLSEREKQVAHLLCEGLKNSEIAERLQISVKTVDTHRGHVLQKLGARNNVELLRMALGCGWVSL